MQELLLTQLVCILLPIGVFGLIYLGIRLFAHRPERFAFRMDLSMMGLALTIIGFLFVWMKNPAGRSPEFEQVMVCLLSGLTFPAVWFAQFLLDAHRDFRARREAAKLRELQWTAEPADLDSPEK
jgi:hypothetical protein